MEEQYNTVEEMEPEIHSGLEQELREQLRIAQSDIGVLKEVIVRMAMKSVGLMKG